MGAVTIEQARTAKQMLLERLGGIEAVNGIGLVDGGECGYAVVVNLRRPLTMGEKIPQEVDGVPVKTRIVGDIRKIRAQS